MSDQIHELLAVALLVPYIAIGTSLVLLITTTAWRSSR